MYGTPLVVRISPECRKNRKEWVLVQMSWGLWGRRSKSIPSVSVFFNRNLEKVTVLWAVGNLLIDFLDGERLISAACVL